MSNQASLSAAAKQQTRAWRSFRSIPEASPVSDSSGSGTPATAANTDLFPMQAQRQGVGSKAAFWPPWAQVDIEASILAPESGSLREGKIRQVQVKPLNQHGPLSTGLPRESFLPDQTAGRASECVERERETETGWPPLVTSPWSGRQGRVNGLRKSRPGSRMVARLSPRAFVGQSAQRLGLYFLHDGNLKRHFQLWCLFK